jgi:hypothetical protein
MGYQIQAIFKVTLHNKDYDLLSQIQAYFGVGKITKHGNTTLQYMIRSPLPLRGGGITDNNKPFCAEQDILY